MLRAAGREKNHRVAPEVPPNPCLRSGRRRRRRESTTSHWVLALRAFCSAWGSRRVITTVYGIETGARTGIETRVVRMGHPLINGTVTAVMMEAKTVDDEGTTDIRTHQGEDMIGAVMMQDRVIEEDMLLDETDGIFCCTIDVGARG